MILPTTIPPEFDHGIVADNHGEMASGSKVPRWRQRLVNSPHGDLLSLILCEFSDALQLLERAARWFDFRRNLTSENRFGRLSEIGAIVTMFSLVIGNALGLLAFIATYASDPTKRFPRNEILGSYIILSLAPLLVLAAIVLVRGDRSSTFAFDRTTVMFGRQVLLISTVIVVALVIAFEKNLLPGLPYEEASLFIYPELESFLWPKDIPELGISEGDEGVYITMRLSSSELKRLGHPEVLNVLINCDRLVSDSWGIATVYGYANGTDEKHRTDPRPGLFPTQERNTSRIEWLYARPGCDNFLKLKLYKKEGAKIGRKELATKLKKNPASVLNANAYGPGKKN